MRAASFSKNSMGSKRKCDVPSRHTVLGRGVKGERPGPSLTEDAVQYERVEVNIQLEAAAEALDRCHRAGPAVLDAVRTGGARVEGEQRTDIHAQHRAAQGVIPGQAVAQTIRQRQHPLAHWHPRQHLVDEGGRVLRHPPPPTARTEASAVAREGQEALEGAVGAPQPREAMGQHAAREELAEFLLDEARQAALVAAIRGFPEEGLQVLTNDGVEHGVLGVTGPIRRVGMRHVLA
jgi:hypothetical protein